MPTEDVQKFARDQLTGSQLVELHPQCRCEDTEPYDHGNGRVDGEEQVMFFVQTPRHGNIRAATKKTPSWLPRGAHLRNATRGHGLSIYRTAYATVVELRQAAERAAAEEAKRTDKAAAGVIGGFQILTDAVRQAEVPEDCGRMCVIDTPMLNEESALEPELSHADMLWSMASDESADDEYLDRRRRFEDAVALSMQAHGKIVPLQELAGGTLQDLLPDVAASNLEGYAAMVGRTPS